MRSVGANTIKDDQNINFGTFDLDLHGILACGQGQQDVMRAQSLREQSHCLRMQVRSRKAQGSESTENVSAKPERSRICEPKAQGSKATK